MTLCGRGGKSSLAVETVVDVVQDTLHEQPVNTSTHWSARPI